MMSEEAKNKPARGYYQMTHKEGGYILRLIDLYLEYPAESKISLIAVKEVIENSYIMKLRAGRKWTSEERMEHSRKIKARSEERKSVGPFSSSDIVRKGR